MTKGRIGTWARAVRRDILAVYLAARDPRVPWYVKLLAVAVAAYALSPIDLIPDFVPVLGYLDDLLIVPAGLWLVVRLVPAEVMADLREQAARTLDVHPRSRVGAVAVIALWLALIGVAVYGLVLLTSP